MATAKAKPVTQAKEKGPSPPSTTHTATPSLGRRSPKPPSSPDGRHGLPTLPDKPTPHHLRPKATALSDSSRSSTTTPSTKRLPLTRKPVEKPPSSSSQLPHRTTPARGKSPVGARSSATPKLTSDRASRVLKGGAAAPPLTRTKSLGSGTTVAKKKVDKEILVHIDPPKPEEIHKLELDTQDHVDDIAHEDDSTHIDQVVVKQKEQDASGSDDEAKIDKAKEEEEEVAEEAALVSVPASEEEGKKEEAAVEASEPKVKAAKEEPKKKSVVVGWKQEGPKSNDVIEETKSKLMEKRKNKVLALVGAFETVISLQEPEGQPSGQHGQNAKKDGGELPSQNDQPRQQDDSEETQDEIGQQGQEEGEKESKVAAEEEVSEGATKQSIEST